jgi:hypothetical protein
MKRNRYGYGHMESGSENGDAPHFPEIKECRETKVRDQGVGRSRRRRFLNRELKESRSSKENDY